MGEMNERDLEQVVGGGDNGDKVSVINRWKKKNCDVCTHTCKAALKAEVFAKVMEYSERGEEWVCRYKK